MKTRRIIAIVVVIAAISIYQIVKYNRGGFENPDVKKVAQKSFIINGIHYRGIDTQVPDVIDSVMTRVKASGKQLPFIVHTVNAYTKDHHVDLIVGVITEDSVTSVSMDFVFFGIPEREVVRGHIKASGAYIGNIDPAVDEFKEKNGIKTSEAGMSQWSNYSEETVRDYYLDFPIVE